MHGPSAASLSPQHAPAAGGGGSVVQLSPAEAAEALKLQRAGEAGVTVREKIATLIGNIEKVIVGKRETVKHVLVGLLARGHVLIEDVPGVGKTTLARALAKSIDLALNSHVKNSRSRPVISSSGNSGRKLNAKCQVLCSRSGVIV